MSSAEQTERDVLIRQLSEAAKAIDKDDLVILADVHEWCESLIKSEGDGAVQAHLTAILEASEQLIMGGCDNPSEMVNTIRSNASAMSGATHGASESNPSTETTSATTPDVQAGAPNDQVSSVIRELSQAVAAIEADNLTLLAKMHGWCAELAATAQPDGSSPDSSLVESATKAGETLESLILGVDEDVEKHLQSLKQEIDALGKSANSLTCEADSNPVTPAPAEQPAEIAPQIAEPEQTTAPSDALAEAEQATPDPVAPADATPSAAPSVLPTYVPEPLLIGDQEIEFVGAFAEEAAEHLEAIEAALLDVEQAPEDTDKINELFRPFHTIKGMAGFLNLRDVNSLTHEVETVLDQGRRGEREMTAGTTELVFQVVDILKAQLASIGAYTQNPTNGPVPQPPVAEMIDRLRGVIAGTVNTDSGDRAEHAAPPTATTEPPLGQTKGTPEPGTAQPSSQSSGAGAPPPQVQLAGDQSVRIDTTKLDALVDMVGELVIAQTLVAANERITSNPKLTKDAGQVSKIVRDVQEVAMAMRMIPIKSTFQKMARLVRDLSRKANKKVELTISGEETELDKNVIQQIGDPLVHMVRNAVDHGIEPAADRIAKGKPECGRVHLNAFHQGGNIVIEISDDGKGLDRDALIVKAIEKGVLGPDDELTDDQAYHLIFAAGFSTATEVTDISGRGVGMDVVKRNIEQLRGRVDITSELGKGSTFSIRLPLTLAIIDGMLVRVGRERFIIATPTIEQALRPKPEQITTVQNRGEVIQVRGRLIPLIQLGQLFRLTERVEPSDSMVVIAHTDTGPVGLVVEELIGQQQVVIKSLGDRFRDLRGVSGAAILGDGKVGLIIDASGIRSVHEEWHDQGMIRTFELPNATENAVDATESQAEESEQAALV